MFHKEGLRVQKTERKEVIYAGSSVPAVLRPLPQRVKTWQRVHYTRTQVSVWHVPATICQSATQIGSQVAEAQCGRSVGLAHALWSCYLSCEPGWGARALSPLDCSPLSVHIAECKTHTRPSSSTSGSHGSGRSRRCFCSWYKRNQSPSSAASQTFWRRG